VEAALLHLKATRAAAIHGHLKNNLSPGKHEILA